MKTVVLSVISISSILLVVMIHITVNEESVQTVEVSDALASAMNQTLTEVMEQGSYGISSRNELVAAFLQAMLQKVDKNISLTMRIHHLDERNGTMDVEAVGEYILPDRNKKQISIRRQVVFAGK